MRNQSIFVVLLLKKMTLYLYLYANLHVELWILEVGLIDFYEVKGPVEPSHLVTAFSNEPLLLAFSKYMALVTASMITGAHDRIIIIKKKNLL